jgi:leucine dehydrogenase
MKIFQQMSSFGHEQVAFAQETASGYLGIIAIHSTALGPAVGGTRLLDYHDEAEALLDVLRLSRAMTYKSALAGVPFGGGKAVIIGDNRTSERERIFRAHGRFVETFGGRFITGEDVGTSTADLQYIHLETKHVAYGPSIRVGDSSPWTARGVFRGIQAAAKHRWGADDLSGKTIALQGCGQVGYRLAQELYQAGAKLIVTDTDPEKVQRVVTKCTAVAVDPASIYDAEADIFAPCALGSILNEQTIPRLRVEIVAGAANNQLLAEEHGVALAARGILYAPDYAINSGGVISGGVDLLGWEIEEGLRRVEAIYDTLLAVFARAQDSGIPPQQAADALAEERLLKSKAG